jgi:hypothetical protein
MPKELEIIILITKLFGHNNIEMLFFKSDQLNA